MKKFFILAAVVFLCASCDRVQKTATQLWHIPANIQTLTVESVNGDIDILEPEDSGAGGGAGHGGNIRVGFQRRSCAAGIGKYPR